MIYIINLLSVATVPMALAAYGGHLAAKVLDTPERRKALTIVWALAVLGVLLSGFQELLAYRSDRAHEMQQAAMAARAEQEQQQLREKLDSSLQRQEDVHQQLDSIVRFLRTPQPNMDMRHLANAASKMVENAMHR